MELTESTKENFEIFINEYKPNLSYGECKIGKFLVINYIDTNRGGKNWQDWLVCRIEHQPEATVYLITTDLFQSIVS